MSRRTIGLLLLLGASELLGLILGQWFYSLFLKTLPPLALSSFNQGTAHAAFLVYGVMSGLAVFAMAFAAAVLSRFFPTQPPEDAGTPSRMRR